MTHPATRRKALRFNGMTGIGRWWSNLLLLCAALSSMPALAASQGTRKAPSPPAATAPVVMAAASLQEALNAAADRWQAQGHPRPRIAYAASSALARQIASGVPADLFFSADEAWMDDLQVKGLIRTGSRTDVLGNRLVLIAPRARSVSIAMGKGMPLARALRGQRLALADPQGVPAGVYARQALTHLQVWDQVRDHLAPAENVRAALALVSRGVAPLGIVYETDALADPKVKIVGRFPAQSHAPIRYPLALITASRNPEAEGFRRYLLSPQGKAVFRRFGFSAL